jgi:EAL domain-containing protein (putative c-di-GMP-specific phosphodiesterase class I)/FixJ family two-component response regulator
MEISVSNGRLLILDDDPAVGATIKSMAAIIGFEARVEVDPEIFFGLLDDWSPTHIALDLVMPEMDGVQVLVELANRRCDARIIITSGLSGRVLEAAGRSAHEHGLNIVGVLSKPFLAAALRDMLLAAPEKVSAKAALGARVPARKKNSDTFEISDDELKRALASHEMRVVYQPKVECATGCLAGLEALARWAHPRFGLIMPDQFIPFAEESGLIDALTDEVLDQALDLLCTQFPGRPACISMSINLSAKTLTDPAFVDRVTDRCSSRDIDPGRLIFELTETSAMEDPVTSLALLTRMRMKGFQLSIDDFGTGYSSMLQLVRMPFSEIKVDKSFVITMRQSRESRTVVKSIVDLGRSLGIKVAAEGVEDSDMLDYLKQIGCDLAQGYFIGRPMQGDQIARWMARATG